MVVYNLTIHRSGDPASKHEIHVYCQLAGKSTNKRQKGSVMYNRRLESAPDVRLPVPDCVNDGVGACGKEYQRVCTSVLQCRSQCKMTQHQV